MAFITYIIRYYNRHKYPLNQLIIIQMKTTHSHHGGQQNQRRLQSIVEVLHMAAKTGIAGATSMAINVFGFMWMRTTMNYQYKNGGHLIATMKKLYNEGGIVRFYRGILPALVVGPVARFGDTACNHFALKISSSTPSLKQLPTFVQTSFGSTMVGFWRLSTLPFDAWKTAKQVHGSQGLKILVTKFRSHGVMTFYQGGVASSISSVASHYPWYVTNNYMDRYFKKYKYSQEPQKALLRAAGIGGMSQLVSDTISNCFKVVKTVKQTSEKHMTYSQIFKDITSKEGLQGLIFRGLKTKLLSNVIQGSNFKILWSYFQEQMNIPKH